ncbi:MAG: orotate phosphoribosyltransferase-like protein [ANME-2 cluster archaeon]|nr:orotate phosphoribosyltransferase-like protein [ANME-2 cluster archaeon]MDF1556871.1 orotate phosphoribosyltransferase-like protein [ANME-2 cluster archaeon]
MKNIKDLSKRALELQQSGLSEGQIADELNVSIDTATWLLAHLEKDDISQAPKDIYVNWSAIGKNSRRLSMIASSITDMLLESLERSKSNVDVVVGVALSGVPIASLIAEELEVELALFQSNKQSKEQSHRGMLSQNFSIVNGKDCVVVDDVITTGNTISNVVSLLNSKKANPTAIGVLIDKLGLDSIEGIPVNSLLKVSRFDKIE